MEEKIKINIEVEVTEQNLNLALAILEQPVIKTQEDLKCFRGLVVNDYVLNELDDKAKEDLKMLASVVAVMKQLKDKL